MNESQFHNKSFTFQYNLMEAWPPLAWVAKLNSHDIKILVYHGTKVETKEDWFGEVVWAGTYQNGDFDKTDIVAGSGVRIRDGQIVFVSPGSTVDRLHSFTIGDEHWISNTLPGLMSVIDASLDPTYSEYFEDFYSIVHGIGKYKRTLRTSAGDIYLTYFNNLVWNGKEITEQPKPFADRRFADFKEYYNFLNTSIDHFMRNMADGQRCFLYRPLGTLSTGYDSTTVTALCKSFGMKEVICFDRPDGKDVGTEIAQHLGLKIHMTDVNAWRKLSLSEIPFIAANAFGEEVHYRPLESLLQGRVLMTGFHGDKVWDKNSYYKEPTIIRGDPSGMALMEFRLWAGFIHCPLPFWGCRQVSDIINISNTDEMKLWDIGGSYTRPICRRIVESIGVPRHAFGVEKRFASRWHATSNEYLTPDTRKKYFQSLKQQRYLWLKKGKIPPLLSTKYNKVKTKSILAVSHILPNIPGYYKLKLDKTKTFSKITKLSSPSKVRGFRRFVFSWAVEEAKIRYRNDIKFFGNPPN